jgi:prephenate dehydratase
MMGEGRLEGVKPGDEPSPGARPVPPLAEARGITPVAYPDTAGAAALVAEMGDPAIAALAPPGAAIYGLDVLGRPPCRCRSQHDALRRAGARSAAAPGQGPFMTTFIFEVKNVPAALYKALGGFATNGVNMTKLESYQRGGSFAATEFYADIVGGPGDPRSTARSRN